MSEEPERWLRIALEELPLTQGEFTADLIGGILFLAGGYFLEASFLNGDPAKYYYAFDIIGTCLILSGIFKLIRGTRADDH